MSPAREPRLTAPLLLLRSRNLLPALPRFLFSLPLKVLLVSNNKLAALPEELGRAKDLMELVRGEGGCVSVGVWVWVGV